MIEKLNIPSSCGHIYVKKNKYNEVDGLRKHC